MSEKKGHLIEISLNPFHLAKQANAKSLKLFTSKVYWFKSNNENILYTKIH